MRNLALISSWDSFIPPSSSSISATTIDLDENEIYVAAENTTLDGQVQVDVWKMTPSQGSNWVIVHRDISRVSISHYSPQVSSRADFHFPNGGFLRWTKQWPDHIFSIYGRITPYCCYYAWGRCRYGLNRRRRRAGTRSSSCSSLFVLIPHPPIV